MASAFGRARNLGHSGHVRVVFVSVRYDEKQDYIVTLNLVLFSVCTFWFCFFMVVFRVYFSLLPVR